MLGAASRSPMAMTSRMWRMLPSLVTLSMSFLLLSCISSRIFRRESSRFSRAMASMMFTSMVSHRRRTSFLK